MPGIFIGAEGAIDLFKKKQTFVFFYGGGFFFKNTRFWGRELATDLRQKKNPCSLSFIITIYIFFFKMCV
jgi:hypothetical protein